MDTEQLHDFIDDAIRWTVIGTVSFMFISVSMVSLVVSIPFLIALALCLITVLFISGATWLVIVVPKVAWEEYQNYKNK